MHEEVGSSGFLDKLRPSQREVFQSIDLVSLLLAWRGGSEKWCQTTVSTSLRAVCPLAWFFLRIQKTTLPNMVNEVLLTLLIKEITVKYYFETPDCHDFISGHIIFGS